MTALTKECRKVLTVQFEHKYKGVPFDSVEPTMRQEIESWFAKRDKNITVKHDKSVDGRPGELLMTYSGETRDTHFKFHVDSLFTLAGSSKNAPSYLRNMNVSVDKREFTR